jgi:hypothetical protein
MRPPRIPARMVPGLLRYINDGILPGEFLQAVLRNDLREAVGRADDENKELLPEYVAWLYSDAPAGCSGSAEKVLAWTNHRGLRGLGRDRVRTDVDDTPSLEDGRDNCNDAGTGEGQWHGRM